MVYSTHTVERGQNVTRIAQLYGLAAEDLIEFNKAALGDNPNLIHPGQELAVPEANTYRVKPGDTLSEIAQDSGTSMAFLLAANPALKENPHKIFPDQIIRLPFRAAHAIQDGDTLSEIAMRHGVTVAALQRANGIEKADFIRAGDILMIPGASKPASVSSRTAPPTVMSESFSSVSDVAWNDADVDYDFPGVMPDFELLTKMHESESVRDYVRMTLEAVGVYNESAVSQGHKTLNPIMIVNQFWHESKFDPRAGSHKGAQGISQLMPATARQYGLHDAKSRFDPVNSIYVGVEHMGKLTNQYGDQRIAAYVYNAGERPLIYASRKTGIKVSDLTFDDLDSFFAKERTRLLSKMSSRSQAYIDSWAGQTAMYARRISQIGVSEERRAQSYSIATKMDMFSFIGQEREEETGLVAAAAKVAAPAAGMSASL